MRVDLSRIQDLTRPRPCKLYTLSRLTSADEIVLLTSGRLGKQAGVTDFEYHGLVGTDGVWMIEELQRRGFPINNITLVRDEINSSEVPSGCAIIQVEERTGENFVTLHPGTNHGFTEERYEEILGAGQPGDVLLMQGETNLLPLAMNYARRGRGMQVIFNASPDPPPLTADWSALYPCDWLIVNEEEARGLLEGRGEAHQTTMVSSSSGQVDHPQLVRELSRCTGANNVIITLGAAGSVALVGGETFIQVPALLPDKVVDTTGAGDVFLGYFVASHYGEGAPVEMALRMATAASSLAVQVEGALDAVPSREAVVKLLTPSLPVASKQLSSLVLSSD